MSNRTGFMVLLGLVAVLATGPVGAQIGPDVIVSNTGDIDKNGTVGGITAYSLATTSCNIGDQVAIWISGNNQHPVIAGNIYRLKDGLMEQVGMSWLKHGFCAVNEFSCGSCQTTPCSTLGLNCADTYGTGLNGSQGNLGPRSEVNASTGAFLFPFGTQGQSGNAIFKRCQVANVDIDPAQNPGAMYFGVTQYITSDETSWGNMYNNTSYRRLLVGSFQSGGWNLNYTGATGQQQDPIHAWQDFESGVDRVEVETPEATGLGQVVVGTRVEDLGGGLYRYQYAVYNNISHRSVRSFEIPLPAGLSPSNPYFNDVDYHSGEPYSGQDWAPAVSGGIKWATQTFAENQNANALRWGTTYSFSFDAPAPPTEVTGTLEMFRAGPGSGEVTFTTMGPSGDFTLPVSDLTCFYNNELVQLSWTNGESYDAVEVDRDGQLIATLPGGATSFDDADATVGNHQYRVRGVVGGSPSGNSACLVNVPPPPPLGFDYRAPTQTVAYVPGTGEASFTAVLTLQEDPGNDPFPNAVYGYAIGIGHDSALLTATAVNQPSVIAGSNGGAGPDFWAPLLLVDGCTLGVVLDLQGGESMIVSSETETALVEYDTVAPALAGDMDGTSTVLQFQNDLGAPPVTNSLVLELGAEVAPVLNSGLITLEPAAGSIFLRSDNNADGSLGLADPIFSLNYQFSGGPSICLKSMDFNDDGSIGLEDAVGELNYQFASGPEPSAPFPGCGVDPTADALDCVGPVVCP